MEQPPPKESRVPVNLRIKFRSETIEQFVERYAIDVSRGGIFIRTREPLAVGTQLKFDFQLQDTSPLMAGEGTVVWIREHDPTRAGVTPGMGVRFDKLTPASQPVLDKILADKGRREVSGPVSTSTTSVSATSSGKSGATALPVRRPSSTFSAVEPSALSGVHGAPTPVAGSPAAAAAAVAAAAPRTAATLTFGGATGANTAAHLGPGGAPPAGVRPAVSPASIAASKTSTSQPTPMGLKSPLTGAGAMPTLETQSALGKLATGPNLSTFGAAGAGSAPRTKSPLPLPRSPLKTPMAGSPVDTASGPNSAGAPAVPTPIEDSEKTQIADGLPDFSGEPTHVGGPALSLAEMGSGRNPSITATSRRTTPTPAPDSRPSLDQGMSANGLAPLVAPGMSPARTTSPDGSGPASSNQFVGPGAGAADPQPATRHTPAGSRPGVAAPAARSTASAAASHAAASQGPFQGQKERKRPTAFIIVGVLSGAIAAAVIATRMTNQDREAQAPVAPVVNTAPIAPAANTEPAGATAPNTANPTAANPESTRTEPTPGAATAAANPGSEAKVGEAKPGEAKVGEAKPGEARVGEAKPGEPKPGEGVGEAKPGEAKTVVVEAAAKPSAPARKQRIVARKKGVGGRTEPAAAELGGEAVEAASAADAAVGNVARITSTPAGAEVLIDGQSVGKTPFQGKDIDPASPHALTVRKDGFETYEHMVSASDWIKGKGAGQSLKVAVKLRKTHGAGDSEGAAGEKKSEKSAEPAAESAKTEPAPAAESP